MGIKSKSWQRREKDIAYCDRCGGVSQYRFMPDWRSPVGPYSKLKRPFTYWYWWREFKKAHRTCPNRNNI